MNKIFMTLALAAMTLPAAALDFDDMTLTPAEGVVEELNAVTFNFPNTADVDINTASNITATKDGAAIAGLKVKGGESKLTVTFPETQTEMGTYVITIGAEAICAFNDDYSDYIDNPEAITATYVIEGAAEAVDFKTFTVDPEVGSMLASLSEMTITFPNLTGIYSTGAPIVTVDGTELSPWDGEYDLNIVGNALTLTFADAITADAATPVKILFYAGSLGGISEEGEGMNANPIEINYTVAPEVVYDLTLQFNSPTKPNADGEISAEKQLDAFFFMIQGTGYLPGEDTQAVTMKSDDGSYEKEACIQKAYGLDSSCSYFSVPFITQPRNNGRYVISFPEGIFGDELWVSNHAFGVSNKAFELEYILIDGVQTSVKAIGAIEADEEIFNLNGVKVSGDTLPAGLYIIGGKKVIKK